MWRCLITPLPLNLRLIDRLGGNNRLSQFHTNVPKNGRSRYLPVPHKWICVGVATQVATRNYGCTYSTTKNACVSRHIPSNRLDSYHFVNMDIWKTVTSLPRHSNIRGRVLGTRQTETSLNYSALRLAGCAPITAKPPQEGVRTHPALPAGAWRQTCSPPR